MTWNQGYLFRRLLKAGLILFSALALSACNQYQDNSLAGDAAQSVCPPGCASNLKAQDSQLQLVISNPSPVKVGGRADISGECYASLFPKNSISALLTTWNGTPFSTELFYGYDSSSTQTIRCQNGRFHFVVNTSGLSLNTNYTLQVKLIAYDASGNAHQNVADGVKVITLQRTSQ